MGNTKRYFLVSFFLAIVLIVNGQNPNTTFQEVDHTSFALYENAEWKALKKFADQAIKEGIDYYYLRMRAGIAYFETEKNFDAISQFEAALSFNSDDPVAMAYLFDCYRELNQSAKAIAVYEKMPSSLKEKLKNALPKMHEFELEGGPIISNQAEKIEQLDIDGAENIYGEAIYTQNGYFFTAAYLRKFKNGFEIFIGYSLIDLNNNQVVKTQDAILLNYQYPVRQQQFYLGGKIPCGKKITIVPALNIVLENFEMVLPELDESFTYQFPVQKYSWASYIGYLSVTGNFDIFQPGIFGAYSNLNKEKQFQAGIQLLVFPLQNLKLYSLSKILDHNNEGQNNLIFEQLLGFRVFNPVWVELKATFGEMTNYYDNQAFAVYNLTGKMNFKGSAKIIYTLNPRWTLSAEYLYFERESNYITYQQNSGNSNVYFPLQMTQEFENQLILLGINWKF